MKRYDDERGIVRRQTVIEQAVLARRSQAQAVAEALGPSIPKVEMFLPEALKDSVFVGHLVTDLDSVAGAIAAACFYGGKAGLASDVNSETAFALERWGIKDGDDLMPKQIDDILQSNPDVQICLVDHQQTSQMNPAINVDNIVGVIDHHALQNKTIVTDR
jgi:manganese-dependent inorganic pyrophosphatase